MNKSKNSKPVYPLSEDRKRFYSELWKDYNDRIDEDKCNSFIYRYFLKSNLKDCSPEKYLEMRSKHCARIRVDSFLYLKSCQMAYKEGIVNENELREVCREITRKTKASKKRADKQEIDDLVEYLLERRLKQVIYDYFNNLGFSKSDSSVNDTHIRDDVLDMYFAYQKESAVGCFGNQFLKANLDELLYSDSYAGECKELYKKLLATESAEEVILPLAFHEKSGAALYIIGANLIDPDTIDHIPQKIRDNKCFFCIVWFEDMDDCESATDEDFKYLYSVFRMACHAEGFSADYDIVVSKYIDIVNCITSGSIYYGYVDMNSLSSITTMDVSAPFKAFFITPEKKRREEKQKSKETEYTINKDIYKYAAFGQ